MLRRIKNHLGAQQKHFCIHNVRAGMHVQAVDVEVVFFYNFQNIFRLMGRNPKLGIDMPHRYFGVAAGQKCWGSGGCSRARCCRRFLRIYPAWEGCQY